MKEVVAQVDFNKVEGTDLRTLQESLEEGLKDMPRGDEIDVLPKSGSVTEDDKGTVGCEVRFDAELLGDDLDLDNEDEVSDAAKDFLKEILDPIASREDWELDLTGDVSVVDVEESESN